MMIEVTVPGAGPVPMGAVMSTAEVPTRQSSGQRHRLTTMLLEARDRGEPLAGLSASEGSSYGRFGFSPASFETGWEVEPHQTAFAPAADADAMNRLEPVGADEANAVWPALHEQIRRTRVGEVSAYAGRWSSLTDETKTAGGATQYVLHRDPTGTVDGIAQYRVPCSPHQEPTGTTVVEACETTTPEAYTALWRALLDLDPTKRIRASHRPVDDPLPWMLTNPRALRVTNSADNLWLRILDVPIALQLRSYGADARLVLDISDDLLDHNAGRWELEATEDGASVSRTNARPDLTLDINALASLYLGGVGPAALATAGRLRQHTGDSVRRLDQLFQQDPAPFCSAGF